MIQKKDFNCPRCKSKNVINYEDTIECVKCKLEFYKKDLIDIKDESTILSIQEKKNIIGTFKSYIGLDKEKVSKLS